MSDDLPREIATSTVELLGIELTIHVLDNGQRVFGAEGFERLVAKLFDGETVLSEEAAAAMARVVHGSHT